MGDTFNAILESLETSLGYILLDAESNCLRTYGELTSTSAATVLAAAYRATFGEDSGLDEETLRQKMDPTALPGRKLLNQTIALNHAPGSAHAFAESELCFVTEKAGALALGESC